MAVENLYNTAVEYHSPLAAKPTSTRPPGPFPVKAQLSKHIVPQDHLCLLQQKRGERIRWGGKNPGCCCCCCCCCCDGFRLLFAIMCHASFSPLIVILRNGACGDILQMLKHTHTHTHTKTYFFSGSQPFGNPLE